MRIGAITVCLLLVLATPVIGFHRGGVGRCDGCHITHDGVPAVDGRLLIAESATDVCLGCHATAQGAVLGSDPLAPPPERGGGNFVFLLEDNINDAANGQMNPIQGEAAGHSIVAPGRGLFGDTRNAVSPGGAFPSDQLGCTSCHDPHGNSNFRLLYGVGSVQQGLFSFTSPAPDATGIGLGTEESDENHTAYRSGVSEWCGNCHGNYHDTGLSSLEHPSGATLEAEIRLQYNSYDGDEAPGPGSPDTAYLAEVPFEDAAATTTSTDGPSSTARVMCLTCHRAHASSAPSSGRWDFNVALLQSDGTVSLSYPIPSPYNGPTQGTLCSKCHGFGGAGGGGARAPRIFTPRDRTPTIRDRRPIPR